MKLEGKKVLVTGSSGFVGRNLASELKGRGAEVLTLQDASGNRIDVRDWPKIEDLGGRFGRVDVVYHLAAVTFIPRTQESPRETYEVNVLGTLNVLELCRLCGARRFVFASAYVYGHPEKLPIDENHPVNPSTPYARSKELGEKLCAAYHEDRGLDCTVVRPFNIYGEGQGENFLIPSILGQLKAGKIELMDPEPKRDFLYVSDAVAAFVRAGECDGSGFRVFNIGSGTSYSVAGIVGRILGIYGQMPVAYRNQRRQNEVMDVVADISKARAELGWEPRVSLEDGLKKCIEWSTSRRTAR